MLIFRIYQNAIMLKSNKIAIVHAHRESEFLFYFCMPSIIAMQQQYKPGHRGFENMYIYILKDEKIIGAIFDENDDDEKHSKRERK